MSTELRCTRPAGRSFREELELIAKPSAVTLARRFTEMFLHSSDLIPIADVACLVVSELATNAVLASEPRCGAASHADDPVTVIGIRLESNGQRLRIEVWDQAVGFPILDQAPADAECGRGLWLVEAITEGHWGWHQVVAPKAAKCVWAEIRSPAADRRSQPTT
jgi:anti-sigma regulatory factor (Ser/Thr protein kinase)